MARRAKSDDGYSVGYCEAVRAHLAGGFPARIWCARKGIAPERLKEWAAAHPEFDAAVKVGEAQRFDHWYGEMLKDSKVARDILEREFGWSREAGTQEAERMVVVVRTFARGPDPTRPTELKVVTNEIGNNGQDRLGDADGKSVDNKVLSALSAIDMQRNANKADGVKRDSGLGK